MHKLPRVRGLLRKTMSLPPKKVHFGKETSGQKQTNGVKNLLTLMRSHMSLVLVFFILALKI